MGASVDSDPSMRPLRPGWTRWSRNDWRSRSGCWWKLGCFMADLLDRRAFELSGLAPAGQSDHPLDDQPRRHRRNDRDPRSHLGDRQPKLAAAALTPAAGWLVSCF